MYHRCGTFFQIRLLQALPRLGYKPRQFFPATSPSGTPTPRVKSVEALNSTYVTGGVRHLLLPILTFGTPADIFYYLFQPRHHDFQIRLAQAIYMLGYNIRHLDFQTRLPQALQRFGY